MQIGTILSIASLLLLGADACFVECVDGHEENVLGMRTACPGSQRYIYAADGFADIVYFDGRPSSCVDSVGFSLYDVPQNVIGCANGVRGKCCGRHRC